MYSIISVAIFMLALFLAFSTTIAHDPPCSESFLQHIQRKNLTKCRKLTTLGAEFGWSSIIRNNTQQIDMIFGARLHTDSGWLAWGVNPGTTPQMVGTRAVIGVRLENGSIITNTYNITGDTKLGCKLTPTTGLNTNKTQDDEVSFRHILMEYFDTLKYYTIQASVALPSSAYNISKLNHVWQVGIELDGTNPKTHPTTLQNVDSTEIIDLVTGTRARHVGRHRWHFRMVHGILNIVGWGGFLPIGVIIARYSKYPLQINKGWFILHVCCQIIGYILGTIGWIIGLGLGSASKFYIFRTHRLYAMFILAFTTLQMLALRLKPENTDDYRKYWNMYHHFLGYVLLAVISINIFNGIDILQPDMIWKWVYTGILVAYGFIVFAFEVYTWVKFKITKKQTNGTTERPPPATKLVQGPGPPTSLP